MLYLIPNSTNSNGYSVFPRTTSQMIVGELYTRTFVSCEVASKMRWNLIRISVQFSGSSKSQPLSLTDVSKYLCRLLIIAICFNILAYSIVIQSHGHQHYKLKVHRYHKRRYFVTILHQSFINEILLEHSFYSVLNFYYYT